MTTSQGSGSTVLSTKKLGWSVSAWGCATVYHGDTNTTGGFMQWAVDTSKWGLGQPNGSPYGYAYHQHIPCSLWEGFRSPGQVEAESERPEKEL